MQWWRGRGEDCKVPSPNSYPLSFSSLSSSSSSSSCSPSASCFCSSFFSYFNIMSSPSRLSSTCPPSILPLFRGNRFSSRFSYRTKSSCTPLTPFALRTSYPSILAACFHLLTVLRDITSWDLSKKVSLR